MYFASLSSGSACGLVSFEGIHLVNSIAQDLPTDQESLPPITKETEHGKITVELKDGLYHISTKSFNSDPTKKVLDLNLVLSKENIQKLEDLVTAIERDEYKMPEGHALILK